MHQNIFAIDVDVNWATNSKYQDYINSILMLFLQLDFSIKYYSNELKECINKTLLFFHVWIIVLIYVAEHFHHIIQMQNWANIS